MRDEEVEPGTRGSGWGGVGPGYISMQSERSKVGAESRRIERAIVCFDESRSEKNTEVSPERRGWLHGTPGANKRDECILLQSARR